MKPVEEISVCVVDYGTFISVAERMARTCKRVCYHSPTEREFKDCLDYVRGDGIPGIERVNDIWEPNFIEDVDLFVFPDIGFTGTQKRLREMGKPVWGSMGADELELYRTRFLETIKDLGLSVVPYEVIEGVTALAEYLQTVEDKWVKINVYREQMETWKHENWEQSKGRIYSYYITFGPVAEQVVFVVQDDIPDAREIGYDGWSVDGDYPESSFQGYEKKNELYLGSLLPYDELPEEVRAVNEAMAPLLRKYGYRNAIASEIRVTTKDFHFIDPTLRWPGQTGEQLLETCINLPDVIWHGAQGELIKPEWEADVVAAATIYHDDGESKNWKVLRVPEKLERWLKLYHDCEVDGLRCFPPKSHADDEVGLLMGLGKDIETAIDTLKEHLEELKDQPVKAKLEGFAELINEVKEAQKHGMKFTDGKIPDPAVAIEV